MLALNNTSERAPFVDHLWHSYFVIQGDILLLDPVSPCPVLLPPAGHVYSAPVVALCCSQLQGLGHLGLGLSVKALFVGVGRTSGPSSEQGKPLHYPDLSDQNVYTGISSNRSAQSFQPSHSLQIWWIKFSPFIVQSFPQYCRCFSGCDFPCRVLASELHPVLCFLQSQGQAG